MKDMSLTSTEMALERDSISGPDTEGEDDSKQPRRSPQEEEMLAWRRAENRKAAHRCRQRKKEHGEQVKKEWLETQCANTSLRYEIRQLLREKEELEELFNKHLGPGCRKLTAGGAPCPPLRMPAVPLPACLDLDKTEGSRLKRSASDPPITGQDRLSRDLSTVETHAFASANAFASPAALGAEDSQQAGPSKHPRVSYNRTQSYPPDFPIQPSFPKTVTMTTSPDEEDSNDVISQGSQPIRTQSIDAAQIPATVMLLETDSGMTTSTTAIVSHSEDRDTLDLGLENEEIRSRPASQPDELIPEDPMQRGLAVVVEHAYPISSSQSTTESEGGITDLPDHDYV